MTSLFTQFVARGLEVPVIDPRLLTHVEVLAVVTQDERPATPVDPSAPDANLSEGTKSPA